MPYRLAQELIDEVNYENMDYDIDVSAQNYNVWEDVKNVEDELHNSIYQELTVPMEERDIYWAQTLIDTV